MKVVFWNVERRKPLEHICQIVARGAADLLILAEYDVDAALTGTLLSRAGADFRLINTRSRRVKVLARTPGTSLHVEREARFWSILRAEAGQKKAFAPFLLVAVHFPSQREWKIEELNSLCKGLDHDIRTVERIRGHQRTLVVGDFNLNPFERGMVDALALHAVMSRDVAEKEKRKIGGESYTFFYNPMWRLMGDPHNGPGTFYYWKSTPIQYFWHTFDQVLVRPALLQAFDDSSLSILRHDGTNDILIHSKARASDHYPIQFSLNL